MTLRTSRVNFMYPSYIWCVMINGDLYDFDLREETRQNEPFVVLELKSSTGNIYKCAWHKDAGRYEVGVALNRLSEILSKRE